MQNNYTVSIVVNTVMDKLSSSPNYRFCRIVRRETILNSEVIEVFNSGRLLLRLVFNVEDNLVYSVLVDDQGYDAINFISQVKSKKSFFDYRVEEIVHEDDFGYYSIELIKHEYDF